MTELVVAMYHYVRDVAMTPFPGLRAMPTSDFVDQVRRLSATFEMASLDAALEFIAGTYQPKRDLCLLTFDDGLREHAELATTTLRELDISGVFLIPTSCVEEHIVLPVHMNHLLMAAYGFEEYRLRALRLLEQIAPDQPTQVGVDTAKRTYRWDEQEVALFKYLVNYALPRSIRVELLDGLFSELVGETDAFARSFYLNWDQARAMQADGMVLGGHTHTHPVLAHCDDRAQEMEVARSLEILKSMSNRQPHWPFAYPFGKPETYSRRTIQILEKQGYSCAFTTEVRRANSTDSVFEIPRLDPKDL